MSESTEMDKTLDMQNGPDVQSTCPVEVQSTCPVEVQKQEQAVVEVSTVELRREVGLVGATSLVIGMSIGSGIFISPKGVLRATGSVGLCLLVWAVAGIAQLGSALCYSELGAMIGRSGGSYTYLRLGLGNMVAFMYALQLTLVQGPCAMVIFLLTFAKYTITLLPVCGSPVYLEKFIAATVLVTLAIVNTYSSRMTTRLAVITTAGKVSALIVIIISGMAVIAQGTTSELNSGFSGTTQEPISLALAMYSAGFAYVGGGSLNIVVEEIKHPQKTLPRAAILGTFVVIVIYMLTNVAYLAVMTKSELLGAEAVAVVFADRVLGAAAGLVPIAVMVSTFGTANNGLFSRSRLVFAAARDHNLPDVFSYIQVTQVTPLGGMSVAVAMTMIMLVPGEVSTLINYMGFMGSFFGSCVYVCFIIFRLKTMKDADRPVKINWSLGFS